MKRQRSWLIILVLLIAGAGLSGWLYAAGAGSAVPAGATGLKGDGTVSGVVVNATGPLAGARVRVRATANLTFTDANGNFLLANVPTGQQIEVASWYTGHYIASAFVTPTVSGLTLTLRAYHTTDHPEYPWTSPISTTGPGACGNCHPMIIDQWTVNAHGGAVTNPRFFSLYDGTDVSGTTTISPGYVLDFPGTAGNCANCHAPGAAVDGYLTTTMDVVRGVITAGVHCDFCHKVGGVYLDPATGTVYPNTPGVQSQRVLRPPAGDNIFFGPFDDIHDPDTYLPLISESEYCAPCHQFSFWGTPIYESFDEWLASPYAAQGITCQTCHMRPNGDSYFALPGVGGLPHPPEQIPSHLQPGAADVALLQDTVTMTVDLVQAGSRLWAAVTITNTGAGHDVPTDHPGRHLILTVQGTDDLGGNLTQIAGPQVPDWGGAQAGEPGKAFAKVLADAVTGRSPVVSYWKQAFITADNRIPALGSDTSFYAFAAPAPGQTAIITAEVRFRRLYQEMMDARGWTSPDVIMVVQGVEVAITPWWEQFVPILLVP